MWISRRLVAAWFAVLLAPAAASAYQCPPGYSPKLHATLTAGRQVVGRGQTVTLLLEADADCKHTAPLSAEELARLEVTSAPSAEVPFTPLALRSKAPLLYFSSTKPGAHFVRLRLPSTSGAERAPVQLVFFVTDAKVATARPLRVTLVAAPPVQKGSPPPPPAKQQSLMLRLLPPTGIPPEQRERWQLPLIGAVLKLGRSAPLSLPAGLYEVGEGDESTEPPETPGLPSRLRQSFRSLLGLVSVDQPGVVKLPFVQ